MGAGIGAYLGAYLKKKGGNLATQEDIDKLVEQVRGVTVAIKEIESRIEDEAWDRQRRWELKRDVLFEINKAMTQMVSSLAIWNGIVEMDSAKGTPRWEKRAEASKKFNEAASGFDESAFRADLVCGIEMARQLYKFGIFMREVADEIYEGKTEAFKDALVQMTLKRDGIKLASRRELGFDEGKLCSIQSSTWDLEVEIALKKSRIPITHFEIAIVELFGVLRVLILQ